MEPPPPPPQSSAGKRRAMWKFIFILLFGKCAIKKKENKTKQFLHQDGYIVFSVLVQISTKTQNHLSACY